MPVFTVAFVKHSEVAVQAVSREDAYNCIKGLYEDGYDLDLEDREEGWVLDGFDKVEEL